MSILISGRIGALALLLLISGVIIYFTHQGARGRKFVLKRTLPALEAIPEAIGRAIEMGRPVHYTPGAEALAGSRGTHSQVAMIIGGYVTRLCAKMGSKITWSVSGDLLPIARDIYKNAYLVEQQPDVEVDVRFYPSGAGPFGTGCIETMAADKSAANMMFGGFGSELPIIAEGGFRVGAFQIGGCSNPTMTPFIVAACDYSMIGEENFAAAAILSENAVQLAGIVALDIWKVIIVGLIILGSLLNTVGVKTLIDLLKI